MPYDPTARQYNAADIANFFRLAQIKHPATLRRKKKKQDQPEPPKEPTGFTLSKDKINSPDFQAWFSSGFRCCDQHAYPVVWHVLTDQQCPRCEEGLYNVQTLTEQAARVEDLYNIQLLPDPQETRSP